MTGTGGTSIAAGLPQTSAPARKGLLRRTAGAVATAGAAGVICWWALRGVDRTALARALHETHPSVIALVALGYTAAFYALDVTGFALVYRRHLTPEVPVRHVMTIVCGKQLLGLIFPPLTKLIAPVYFRRHWRVGIVRTLGATEVLTIADAVVVIASVSAGTALGRTGLPAGIVLLGIGACVALALFFLWAWLPAAHRVFPRIRGSQFLAAFIRSSPAEMTMQLTLRLALVLATLAAWWLLLLGSGHRLGPGQLAQFGALFLVATQLPVSVGGYGGPQGVCVLLLTDTWKLLPRADAVAVSLLWSTAYLLSRALISAFFAAPMIRLLRSGTSRAEKEGEPCTVEPSNS
jgi:hypothetical protein